ncbi:hypothetical protein DFH11DRAFT_1168482 [Phellopilus nigrolimitatus]|nr:hypothetical protein DFH11DRAFT_1168482 [Phellopilus nigrolimitatus]
MGNNSSSYDVFWVVESETLRRLSQELAVFTDRPTAIESCPQCVTSLLVMDIYCRTAMLRALSTTRYAKSPEFVQSTRTQQVRNSAVNNDYLRAFYRYCDADGKLKHVCENRRLWHRLYRRKKYCLKIDDEAVLKLRVQRGEAFSSVGHYPIVAGCTTNGELAYLAVSHYSKIHSQHIFAVTEGMKPESLRLRAWDSHSNSWRMRTPESFVVYVLRYEPAAYARTGRYGSEGLDPTGPFSWRPVRQEYSPLSDMWVEEAQIVSEGSGSDEEAWERDNEGNESDEEAWETFYGGSLFPSD